METTDNAKGIEGLTIRERLTRDRTATRDIDGVGPVKFRMLKLNEAMELFKEQDQELQARKLVALSVIDENDRPVFASPDEVMELTAERITALAKAAVDVNGLNPKEPPETAAAAAAGEAATRSA